MQKVERILNNKLVRRLFLYYGTKGNIYIDELFGINIKKTPFSFIKKLPLMVSLNMSMKKIGITEKMKNNFFSGMHNRQTIKNMLLTIGKNGLKQPFRFDAPPVVVWNYTNICNLRCRYCYQSAGKLLKSELSFQEKIKLINQMVDANVAFLAFSGGEPLLEDHFWDVLRYASRFLHTSIASNGVLLADKSVVDRIADCGAKNVFVSIDGATAASHDFIRGEGNFRKTIEGIKNLVANKYLHVGINMVVTQRNYHEVPEVLKLASDLGVNTFSHYNFIPTGRGKNDFENDLTPEQREKLLNLLFDWHLKRKETGMGIISTSPAYGRILYERTGGESAGMFHYTSDSGVALKNIISYAGGCGAGRAYCAVQPDGKVSPCVFMPDVIIGDTRKENFYKIWQNSELCRKLSERENYNHNCTKYKYICGGCRARALAYGDILGGDPGCLINKMQKEEEKLKHEKVRGNENLELAIIKK